MKKLTELILNLKISSKIWLCMLGIALTLSLFIGLFSSWYFARLYQEDSYNQTADSLQIGSQSLTDAYHLLLNHAINFASTSDFAQIVEDAHNNNQENYVRNRTAIQEALFNLTAAYPLLDSVAIIGRNGEYYTLFTNALKRESNPASFFGWNLDLVRGISWLPLQNSPYIKNNQILPVILPIAPLPNSNYLNIAEEAKDADVFLILMLDSKNIAQRLALSNSPHVDRTLYIANEAGENLSLPSDSFYFQLAEEVKTKERVAATEAKPEIQLLYNHEDYSLYAQPLNFSKLCLVSILPKGSLYHRIFRMNAFIFIIVILGLIMAAFLSFLLSRFVTRPFKRLIMNVQNIENNTYDSPFQMKYHDEIGHLNMAINSMYATIRQQFEHIKQSERAKYRSEIQLLSEQINPHFLYNTLECINMEVLSGHKESASCMITSLGDFLRIGLSYGNEIILVSKELTHVKAYIDIMNHRFSRKIKLECSIDPELENLYLLKSILQPLVENSIRHGFDMEDGCCDTILMPEIQIHIFRKDTSLLLEVSDNGRGIDIEKANAAIHPSTSSHSQKHHVGLNNVYQRLDAYYGEVSIRFETIPYYQNTVSIVLPIRKTN